VSEQPSDERPPIPDRPLLRGEKVWLRPLEERDLSAHTAAINDSEVGLERVYLTTAAEDKCTRHLGVREGWLQPRRPSPERIPRLPRHA
jgi:hypothetical protein